MIRVGIYAGLILLLFMIAFRFFMPHEDHFTWQLGVDKPLTYSSVIEGTSGEITISGSQKNVGEGNMIEYILVQKKSFESLHSYQTFRVKGDKSHFQHKFTNIANDSDYQIKIYNYSRCLCQGSLTVD